MAGVLGPGDPGEGTVPGSVAVTHFEECVGAGRRCPAAAARGEGPLRRRGGGRGTDWGDRPGRGDSAACSSEVRLPSLASQANSGAVVSEVGESPSPADSDQQEGRRHRAEMTEGSSALLAP